MEKAVVLNSGGFDSTVLLADLSSRGIYDLYSMYFSYGQPNDDLGKTIAKENAEKLGANHIEVNLPEFSWSKSSFYDKDLNDFNGQYLEMRNMVFISYALSYAQSVGADSIYVALIGDGVYPDCCDSFIQNMNNICNIVGVSLKTPFVGVYKNELFPLAKKLGLGKSLKFISCDTPVNGKPCGKCMDCKDISEYMSVLEDKIPVMRYFSSGMNFLDEDFNNLFMKSRPSELRVLLNNSCQLNCKHCYHRNNPLLGDILTDDKLVDVIKEAYEMGIKNIQFAGKEPLYDDRIFRITERLSDIKDLNFLVVTNGINVPKYAKELEKYRFSEIMLSVSDIFGENNETRPDVNGIILKALDSLITENHTIKLFYDLTNSNIGNTVKNVQYWNNSKYSIDVFHVRTLKCTETCKCDILNFSDLQNLYTELAKLTYSGFNLNVELSLGAYPYVYEMLHSDIPECFSLADVIESNGLIGSAYINNNFSLIAECYCGRYENIVTVTPEGYVLGCSMEGSIPNYDKISAGNVRDLPLHELIYLGKRNVIDYRKIREDFSKCSFNPIDNL